MSNTNTIQYSKCGTGIDIDVIFTTRQKRQIEALELPERLDDEE